MVKLRNARHLSLLLMVVFLAGLTGCCKKPHYTARPLKPLTKEVADFVQTKEQVTVMVKKLTREDCKEIFDGRTFPKKIVPLQISVANNSTMAWILVPHNISLPCIDESTIEHMLRYDATTRSLLGILGFFAIPTASISMVMACFSHSMVGLFPLVVIVAGFATITPILMGVSLGVAVTTLARTSYLKTMNTQISADLNEKALYTPLTIMPAAIQNKLIFAKSKATTFHAKSHSARSKSCTQEFSIALTGENNGQLIFDVNLGK